MPPASTAVSLMDKLRLQMAWFRFLCSCFVSVGFKRVCKLIGLGCFLFCSNVAVAINTVAVLMLFSTWNVTWIMYVYNLCTFSSIVFLDVFVCFLVLSKLEQLLTGMLR